MLRTIALLVAAALVISNSSCKKTTPSGPVVVRVLRAQQLAEEFSPAEAQFALAKPRVQSGAAVTVEHKDDPIFADLAKRLDAYEPDVVILLSSANVPEDAVVRNRLGISQAPCGFHPTFIPSAVSGEKREAAEMYVRFVALHCAAAVTPPAITGENASPAVSNPREDDPNRPVCNTPRCQKIRQFLKEHYCGESPFGNGPDDGCDTRGDKNRVAETKITADYVCDWREGEGNSKCEQRGAPSPQAREILLREMEKGGFPAKWENDLRFTLLESAYGWQLMSASYGHISGTDLTVGEAIIALSKAGEVHVLRTVPVRKTDADVPDVTTWTLVDVADVDGDGQLNVILQADAYENHWFEVIDLEDLKTVFSGLGYYL